MKISLLKLSRKKEVIKRIELSEVAEMIRENPEKDRVFKLRLNYQFYKPQRMPDGQITLDDQKHTVNLPRLLFAVEGMNYKEMQKGLKYNGLVVVEVNGLKTYEDAVNIRNQAARMDETVMAFLGASGKSVKIVCRGEMFRKADMSADQTTPPDGTPPTQEGKILPTRWQIRPPRLTAPLLLRRGKYYRRGKMRCGSFIRTCTRRRGGRIRTSSGWTSSIWSLSWSGRFI